MHKIEAEQMPAVIVNVVLARNLTVGWNIDTTFDLILDRLGNATSDDIRRLGPEISHRFFPKGRWIGGIRAVGMVKPVRQLYKFGLRISA